MWSSLIFAQPPNISYPTPQTYYVGLTIPNLTPTNTCGAIPKTRYGTVTTITGNGGPDDNFNNPASVAVDFNNDIYVADAVNNLIKKITRAGNTFNITTIGGTGSYGNSNGLGTALTATFQHPISIAVTNQAGTFYIADEGNGLIRKVTAGIAISNYSGSVTQGYADGAAATAKFSLITGMVCDPSGDLYVADYGNNMIRKVATDGTVSTLAGNIMPGKIDANGTLARFNKPANLTIDATGNLYLTDFANHIIRKITQAGVVTTQAGSGTAGNADGQSVVASFNSPYGLAIDGTGNIYVADQNNFTIRRIGIDGTVVVIAGNNIAGTADGEYTTATFTQPGTMVLDYLGNLILTEPAVNHIRQIVATGYTISPSQLPTGLKFDPTTGIISGKPTATWKASDYTITAYNAGGSSTTKVNIEVIEIGLNFNAITAKTPCDADFDPGATTSIGTITYTSSNTAVATIINGKVHIVGIGTSIITANNGYGTVQQPLIVNNGLTPAVTLSALYNNICQGSLVTYTASAINGGNNPVYQWYLNGVIVSATGNTYASNTFVTGDLVTCTATNTSGCVPVTSSPAIAAVKLMDKAIISVSISSSANAAVCPGTAVTFTASTVNVPDMPQYQWQVNGLEAGTNSAKFTSNVFNDGDLVTCSITSAGQCLVSATALSAPILVNVLPQSACTINIPNTFTPNGDGFNDTWIISLPLTYKNPVVTIFARSGQVVYRSVGYTKPWDGTRDGKTLPVATYYYLIDTDTQKKISGSVTIIR